MAQRVHRSTLAQGLADSSPGRVASPLLREQPPHTCPAQPEDTLMNHFDGTFQNPQWLGPGPAPEPPPQKG